MYLSASPLLRGPHLWGPPRPGNAGHIYAGAWAAASGRVALAAALQRLGLKAGQRVLLPAYLCPSVLAPLEHLGLEPDLYPLTPNLEPDWAGLKSRLAGAGAMVAIHYWGFPQPVGQVAGLAREAGVPLIEDCALALFSRRGERLLGSFGQAAVFSLTKSLPTPDGGLLWLADQEAGGPPPAGANRLGLAGLLAYRGEDLIKFSPRTFLLASPALRARAYQRQEGPGQWGRPISETSWAITQRIQAAPLVFARREKFMAWVEALGGRAGIRPFFAELPEGVCPLGFPVLAPEGRRDAIRDGLHRRGVAVRSFWDTLPALVNEAEFPQSVRISRRIMTLPVHEGVSRPIMNKVAAWLELLSR